MTMPLSGFGTAGLCGWQASTTRVTDTIRYALRAGYRHIDTAPVYGNEENVGRAIVLSGIPRKDIFVSTKLGIESAGHDPALRAFEESRKRLGLEYLDLYLVHWPNRNRNRETWKALERLYEDQRVRSIGVCNFSERDLSGLLEFATVLPVCNQIEVHPYFSQPDLRRFCRTRQIQAVSWSPLGMAQWRKIAEDRKPINDPVIRSLARRHHATRAQVILAWHRTHGLAALPKSDSPARIRENLQAATLVLEPEEMTAIDRLDRNTRFGTVPAACR
ncbi:MAG: aldo/keto reductase [Gammaproteobacteria bacterium]|nr:aldo/keto reductase [Gammaproteobacteria bacterium]